MLPGHSGRWLVTLLAVLVIAYLAAGPYITVYHLRMAAKERDASALSEYVDFPRVRQSLKDQINARLLNKMASNSDAKDNPFGVLASAFAGTIVDKMVDAYMTPEGLVGLMSGDKVVLQGRRQRAHSAANEPLSGGSMSYESLNEFVVQGRGDSSKFVLRRYGLGGKLAEIQIPADQSRPTR